MAAVAAACVCGGRESGTGPGRTDRRQEGNYALKGVLLRQDDTEHILKTHWMCDGLGVCAMPVCHRRERTEVASSGLYLPRRETNTRSRCLTGVEYY